MSAIISACGAYRYRLDRVIDMLGGPTVAFCLLNPSTADHLTNDATSRRGIAFAKSWRASRMIYINPWAGRSTKPRNLWLMSDPVGEENDHHIETVAREVVESGGFVVVAWGAICPPASYRPVAATRLKTVEKIIRSAGCELMALGSNKDGSPKHPLYVRKDAPLSAWPFSRSSENV